MPKEKMILIVDDNSDVRYSIIEGLKSVGCDYEFIEVEDGLKCMDSLKKDIPDLLQKIEKLSL